MNPMVDSSPLLARAGGGRMYANGAAADFGADFGAEGSIRGSVGGGTHTRVAATLLVAGAALALLKYAGFRFNVGVTS